ncbi:MAG: cbb3-type cytochrome oxidase assembly protein CcoS [Flavobacteriaceae bacterium]|nr:cbb3-type cytochrome oxidase assembly protein CcoS [Flavobacteriaceae bacterium]
MSIIYMLLAISVVVAIVFFIAFVLSVRKGQYDDTYTPSVRMLFDDGVPPESSETQTDQPTIKNSRNQD